MKKFYITALILVVVQLASFASELNLRILRNGQHSVTIYNQTQTNNINYYQFFGLNGSSFLLTVTDQWSNQVLFNNYVQIPQGTVVSAELDQNGNLNILNTQYGNNVPGGTIGTVGNVNYGNQGNNYPGNSGHINHHPNNGYGNGHQGNAPNWNGNNQYFNQFVLQLQQESFDSNRLKDAKNYAKQGWLSAYQVNEIAKTFTFDSNRLDWAKFAYSHCQDKQNYFLLQNTFTFASNYNQLQSYIANQ